MHICTNETYNNKYTFKSTPLATHNKTIFLFKCPMARRTTCSSLATSNEIISIKALQWTIKSSRAKVIRIYKADGTDCLMSGSKLRKFHTVNLVSYGQTSFLALGVIACSISGEPKKGAATNLRTGLDQRTGPSLMLNTNLRTGLDWTNEPAQY